MATALDIIKRAMRLLGVYSIGETPSSEESSNALSVLNAMLDSWANDNLYVYVDTLNVVNLTAGVPSYTVGPSGGNITSRPLLVKTSSYITYLGVSYPIVLATLNDYNAIPVKDAQGIPSVLYVAPGMPNVTLTLWPVPSVSMALNLWSNQALQAFASLTDVLVLPLGYERALSYCLAEELGPEFEVPISADIHKKVLQAVRAIRRTNTVVPRLGMPYGIPNGHNFVSYRNA